MSWISRILYGVDLDEEQARGTALDEQLRQDAADSLASGRYDQAAYDQAMQHIDQGAITDVTGSVTDAFYQGMGEGAANIRGTVGSAISSPFKLIPWQLWLVVIVGLFLYMGGGSMLKGVLKK